MKSDYNKLHPCLFFAIFNAFAATKSRTKQVTVVVAERVLGFTDFLEISVIGGDQIFDKEIEDLFHPFNSSLEKYRGYAGLASVRRLANDMGGFAEIDRNVDKPTIYIVIPVTK